MPSVVSCSKGLRVAMLAYTFYESDTRVRKYAETLARMGNSVDIISLRPEGESSRNQLEGVKIYRIQERKKNEKGKLSYLIRMLKFFIISTILVSWKHLKHPYHVIHVHSLPDFEVFATFLPRLFGAKVILDIHDPLPDFFSAKFGYDTRGFYCKMLGLVEKWSCRYAHHVITVTDYWKEVIKKRSNISERQLSTIVNYPDTELFNSSNMHKISKRYGCFTIIYPGTLNKHCGLHIVIEAIAILVNKIPHICLHVYGKGDQENELRSLASRLGLNGNVHFFGSVPIEHVPTLMANADIGIALLSGNSSYSIHALNSKLFEFLAMGLPAVATRVESIESYLGEEVVMLSNPNDPADVAACILELYCKQDRRDELRREGLKFIEKNNWQSQVDIYLGILQGMFEKRIDGGC
jgi:glycosyltransferase involved in cell wall biosynthesis